MNFEYIDVRQLHDILGESLISKVRRNVNYFLPPDPLAKRRSGYKRKMSLNDAFRVFLGTYLVSVHKFSYHDAEEILNDLKPWMASVNLFPEFNSKRSGIDAVIDLHNVKIVDKNDITGKFSYICKGYPKDSEKIKKIKDGAREVLKVVDTKYYYDISSKVIFGYQVGRMLQERYFFVGDYLDIFMRDYANHMGNENIYNQWRKEWETAVS